PARRLPRILRQAAYTRSHVTFVDREPYGTLTVSPLGQPVIHCMSRKPRHRLARRVEVDRSGRPDHNSPVLKAGLYLPYEPSAAYETEDERLEIRARRGRKRC